MNSEQRNARDLANELFEAFEARDEARVLGTIRGIEAQAVARGFLGGSVVTCAVLASLWFFGVMVR
jgi:hypothetical protein